MHIRTLIAFALLHAKLTLSAVALYRSGFGDWVRFFSISLESNSFCASVLFLLKSLLDPSIRFAFNSSTSFFHLHRKCASRFRVALETHFFCWTSLCTTNGIKYSAKLLSMYLMVLLFFSSAFDFRWPFTFWLCVVWNGARFTVCR